MLQLADLEQLSVEFEHASPQTILEWATETFGDKLAVVTSFQPTGIVTLHMLSAAGIAPRTPILTLDTGLLFHETYDLIDYAERQFNLNLIRVRPELSVDEQDAQYGANLWGSDPNHCCHMRKVVPLDRALRGYDAWVTGLRRDQSSRRATTPVIGWDKKHQKIKLCPFASWTEGDVWDYIKRYDLPYNQLHDYNYPSIGCWPCTQAVEANAEDRRAGRWANRGKTECGIHVGNL